MAKKGTGRKKASRRERRAQQQRDSRMRLLRIGGIVVLAVVVLGVVGFYRTSTAPAVEVSEEIMAANIDGLADAPISIVEFGDFGCPSCRAWHNSGIKRVLHDEFGDQISFTFRHFPVITQRSPDAAEASQCAAEQGRFWEFHDFVYEQTPQGALSDQELRSYAAAVGTDVSEFDTCYDSNRYREYVNRDRQAAFAAGAAGTPTFFINGQQVSFSFDAMAAIISHELNS
jgi:protein-disulfide isomerase